MVRPAALCCVLISAVLAGTAHASIDGFKSLTTPPKTSGLLTDAPPAGWRGFAIDSGNRELAFSPEGPGPTMLSLSCKMGGMDILIRAPTSPGVASAPSIRLSSGGFVRVFFARQVDGDAMVIRAPANDEMLQMFRKTGRIMAGRAQLIARTPGEKTAIEDFFAACA